MTIKMGYIYTTRTRDVGRMYRCWSANTIYKNIFVIPFHDVGARLYEVALNGHDSFTVVREISKDEFIKRCTGRHIYSDGTQMWYVDRILHRTDGPAVIYSDGGKEWRIDGNLHRDDGPAEISRHGDKYWCIDDNMHREDGPAAISSGGTKEWWIDNQQVEPPL